MGDAQIINIAPKPGDLCFTVVGSSQQFLGFVTEIGNRIAAITDGERGGLAAVLCTGDGGLFHILVMELGSFDIAEPDQPGCCFRASVSAPASASLGHGLENIFKKIKNHCNHRLFMQHNSGGDAHARAQ